MKLALVSVDIAEALPPLGLGYLASYLREYANFENTIIVDKEDSIKRISKEKPDVVGISCTTMDYMSAKRLAYQIKEKFDLPLIIGGFHVSALPQKLDPVFDVGVIGEGEQTLVELVDAFEKSGFENEKLSKINGICFHDNDRVKITPRRDYIKDLDTIPYPARDLMRIDEYYLKPARHTYDKLSRGTSIITTRGCPYNCIFCAQRGFWRGTMRFNSAAYIVNEMKILLEKYKKIEMLRIMDDLFIADKKRVGKIAELMKKEGLTDRAELHMFGRANLIDEEMVSYLKGMNVKYINFGFESGSDKILKYLKGGSVTVEQNIMALDICDRNGLKVDGSFIFGTPGETPKDIELTFKLMRNPKLKSSMIFQLSPVPQSRLWEIVKAGGKVSDDMDFDLLHAKVGSGKLPYFNDEIPQKEFREKWVPKIWEEYYKCNYRHGLLKFKLSYLFDLRLIKRFLKSWKGFSREAFIRVKKKYFPHNKESDSD